MDKIARLLLLMIALGSQPAWVATLPLEGMTGSPSVTNEKTGYRLWVYGIDGEQVFLDSDQPNSCRDTLAFWLQDDGVGSVRDLDVSFHAKDVEPWGCSLLMDMKPNQGDGGVSGYVIRVLGSHIMAINHFAQRMDDVRDVMVKVNALRNAKPQL